MKTDIPTDLVTFSFIPERANENTALCISEPWSDIADIVYSILYDYEFILRNRIRYLMPKWRDIWIVKTRPHRNIAFVVFFFIPRYCRSRY